MKKKIVLLALLFAAVGGMAFAQSGRKISFVELPTGSHRWELTDSYLKAMGIYGIEILSVTQTLTGIKVSYKCPALNRTVNFKFTVLYSDGTDPKTWENKENIRGARNSSTWNFAVLNCYHIETVFIEWS
jgi:hypothetical protein